jgi:eukaryotic-like serine/threonine-protein kinase
MSDVAGGASLPRRLGRYEVVGFLAAGGMAEVLLGRFLGPDGFERPIVLKRILPHLARENSFVQMFLDEARIIARIRHPNVVQVHELVREEGELFMVMEYLEGESASSLIRRLAAKGEQLDPVLAAHIIASACAGLHAAHQLKDEDGRPLGVVHRDVSPQNVFVSFDGLIKILDFGIAKSAHQVSRTETGQVKGKFGYMSPEQALAKGLDLRSDVFALSVVLYELLTGRRLFQRATPLATLKAITTGPIVPPSRLNAACPVALERICLRGLHRRPEDRYETADVMRHDLLAAMRKIASDATPGDQLAALMERIFVERKQEKEEMLRRVRAGSFVADLPAPEADASVDVPIADDGTGVQASITYDTPPRRGRRLGRTAGLVALLTIAAAVALGTRFGTRIASPAMPVASDPIAPSVPTTTTSSEPMPTTVRIQIETVPSGADVSIDGQPRGATPLELHLNREEEPHTIDVQKPGFSPLRDEFTPNLEQKLRFTLSPVVIAAPQPRPRTPPRSSATVNPTHVKW